MTKEEYNRLVIDIDNMLDTQRVNCTDEYMRGMYNGMEFIRSMVTKSQPIYINSDGSFDEEDILACPERFI